jgi:hypothetical protein
MTETRKCRQCGASFVPRREHARFCSARCRRAWNGERASTSPASGEGALDWAVAAMRDAVARLLAARGWDQPDGFAVITEAVWWVTMVDATLVRYHPDAYAALLAGHDAARREQIEDTFAGLRFVRNQMGYKADHDEFISAKAGRYGASRFRAGRYRPGGSRPPGSVAAWTWKPLPEPALPAAPQRAQEWEMARYRAYQRRLAGRAVEQTFSEAAEFLSRAAESSLARS